MPIEKGNENTATFLFFNTLWTGSNCSSRWWLGFTQCSQCTLYKETYFPVRCWYLLCFVKGFITLPAFSPVHIEMSTFLPVTLHDLGRQLITATAGVPRGNTCQKYHMITHQEFLIHLRFTKMWPILFAISFFFSCRASHCKKYCSVDKRPDPYFK